MQRVRALNLFLHDVYHDQKILRDGRIPAELVFGARHFRREMIGLEPPGGVYAHVAGVDIIRDEHGEYLVLEDNLRSPSGASYMLENRSAMKRDFAPLFERYGVLADRPVPAGAARRAARSRSAGRRDADRRPADARASTTPRTSSTRSSRGTWASSSSRAATSSATTTSSTCARRTGCERIDVIYRRVDDEFLDPLVFDQDSLLGAPGILNAYRAGNVTIANALGTGVADDKAVYRYVPEMIRYYLGEEPVLDNVPTYLGATRRPHVHPRASRRARRQDGRRQRRLRDADRPGLDGKERDAFRRRIKTHPREYIAQPTIALSRMPIYLDELRPAHIDLRPFVLSSSITTVVPGGLTRAALRDGSLVVNSSQGGGSKDTWVLRS